MALFGKPYVSEDLAVKENGLQFEIHVDVFNPFNGKKIGTVLLDQAPNLEAAEHFAAHYELKAVVTCACGMEDRELFTEED